MQHQSAMIRTVQIRNFRCLRHVDLRLDERFHVLVGPNGSGKSTLFDAIQFVFDLINLSLERAVEKRTRNFQDLVWARPSKSPGFEIAIEFDVRGNTSFRYEVAIQETSKGLSLSSECGYLGGLPDRAFNIQRKSDSVLTRSRSAKLRPVFRRLQSNPGRDGGHARTIFYSERDPVRRHVTLDHRSGPSIRLVPGVDEFRLFEDRDRRSSATRKPNMPTAAAAVRQLLNGGVRSLQLDSRVLRSASPPNGDDNLRLSPDGGNLPWILESFRQDHEDLFQRWLRHLRTSLKEIADIRTVRREDDRHGYLMIRYTNGVKVPSWSVSEGTLRLLVLTLLAYLPKEHPVAYLLEEPENGIHPMAIETAYQSLSSVYDSQLFVASHSPTFLRCVSPKEVLCFASDSDGSTVITPGDQHPRLSQWQESVDNDLLFAADILG